jgi:hypothetical protein
MASKKFKWNEGLVEDTFSLKRFETEKMLLLFSWLDTNEEITDIDFNFLEELRREAVIKIESWNEEELKMNYLSFIVRYAYYNRDEGYNVYFDRPIVAEVEGHKINVIVDFMIAQGVRDYVKKPYFCFHEYKREKKYNDDPIAQVLLAMLAAQENNKNGKPLYGAYIIGRNWHFMVLENKNYAISKAYDCTEKDDLYKIIAVLRKFRTIIKTTLL